MEWKEEINCLLLKVFLVFLVPHIKCNAQQDSSWNWTHPVHKTTLNENGNLVTVDHIKFKRYNHRYIGINHMLVSRDTTKPKCGILCMEHPLCLSWIFYASWRSCNLYNYKFQSYPLKAFIYSADMPSVHCYEVEVNINYWLYIWSLCTCFCIVMQC